MSDYVIFHANPNCCEKCSELDGMKFPDTTNLYDVSHPNCKCSLEIDGEEFPVRKLLDAAAAVFDPDETDADAELIDPKASRKAGATFKTIKESYLPMMKLDDNAALEDEKEYQNAMKTKQRRKAQNCQCGHCENEVLEEAAMKDTLNEEFYTGFTYTNQPETQGAVPEGASPTTYDFGSTLVQVSPLGNFVGTDADGKPVDETVTLEALRRVLANIEGEILVDVDHASERGDETKAAAWASDFMVAELTGNSSGLYARLRWTKYGRELVENREYRYLSPVWTLDEENRPVRLISIALTNRPALKGISPIINSEPQQTKYLDNKMDKEILEIVGISPVDPEKGVSEEEKTMALEKIKAWKDFSDKAEAEKKAIEVKHSFDECVADYDVAEDKLEEMFELFKADQDGFKKMLNACGMKKAKNEETKEEEVKEEVKEDVKEDKKEDAKEDTEEVIEKEALNSSPTIPAEMPKSPREIADTLHGEAFLKYVREHAASL